MVMKCPRCVLKIHRAASACPHCGFTLADADGQFGGRELRLRCLADTAGLLRHEERDRVEAAMGQFRQRFPQLFVAIYTGALGEAAHLRRWLRLCGSGRRGRGCDSGTGEQRGPRCMRRACGSKGCRQLPKRYERDHLPVRSPPAHTCGPCSALGSRCPQQVTGRHRGLRCKYGIGLPQACQQERAPRDHPVIVLWLVQRTHDVYQLEFAI